MYKHFFKRFLDIFISIAALPFFAIIFIIVAPLIFFTDKGPVFYCGKRIGRNGKIFKMFKFRSMMVNAPDIRTSTGSTYNGNDDPRVTKIGRILRKTSIDEIPQILNVLKGDMSIIGPRPDTPDWLTLYPEEYKVFLTVRPGITGHCQAYYRNSADEETKMKSDADYATHCTFWNDIKIILKTIEVVLLRKNLYRDDNQALESSVVETEETMKK